MNRYKNKRMMTRSANGRFVVATGANFGLGAACPVCRHITIRYYDGDPKDSFVDPRKFRFRCYTCEPMTEQEKAAQEAEVKARAQRFEAMFDRLVKS